MNYILKTKLLPALILAVILVSCGKVKKKDVIGDWRISNVVPKNGWEVIDDSNFGFQFFGDSMSIIHHGEEQSFYYNIIDNNLILDEVTQYGKITDIGDETMTIKINRSEFSFVFEKQE